MILLSYWPYKLSTKIYEGYWLNIKATTGRDLNSMSVVKSCGVQETLMSSRNRNINVEQDYEAVFFFYAAGYF